MVAKAVECTVKPALKTKDCWCKQVGNCLRIHLKMKQWRRRNQQMSLMIEHWKIQLRMRVQMMHH
jgi:hypothetical protein